MKGWSLTVAAALYGYAAAHSDWRVAVIGFLPALAFWFIDAYFLRQERLYRHLYNETRAGTVEPFCMDARPYEPREPWRKTLFSLTLSVFYGLICSVGVAVALGTALSGSDEQARRTASATSPFTVSFHGSVGGHNSPMWSPVQRGTRWTWR
jgi:hypothetical protein